MMKPLSKIAATVAALVLPGCPSVSDNVVLAGSVVSKQMANLDLQQTIVNIKMTAAQTCAIVKK